MTPSRTLFLAILLFGLAATAAFHASGAVSEADARLAVTVDGSLATTPPHPVTARLLRWGVDVVRLVWAPTGLFRALHLAAGFLLALAAAVSALVAARAGAGPGASGLAAAILVGACVPLGADVAGLGLTAHPVPVLLALLAGAAWAWTSPRPRPLLGGLLLGLAVADHPLVLFLLPGFGAFAMQATLKVPAAEGGRLLVRSAAGFVLGFAAVLLPLLDARNDALLHVTAPRDPLAALAAWASAGDGAFWAIGGPRRWLAGVIELVTALVRNAGPAGLALGLAGLAAFFGGAARLARPFLLVHGGIAVALILGDPADDGTAVALAGWSFLFWTIPALARIEARLAGEDGARAERAARLAPVVAAVAAAALLAVSARDVDRSAEKGVTWTSTMLETLPPDSILLTRNPVALALAADGLRPDLDVVHLDEPSTLTAFRTGRALLPLGEEPPRGRIDPETIVLLVQASEGGRAVLFDASVYFDPPRRDELLGGRWWAVPHGLAFRLRETGKGLSLEEREAAAFAWDGVPVTPDTPPSPLRGGLGGSAYFARSLVQSAYLHDEQDRELDAEREFLLALGHPGGNANVAAVGFARMLFAHRSWREVVRTLETYVRDDQDGAWLARRLEGNTWIRLGDRQRALAKLRHALRLTPATLPQERTKLQATIRNLEAAPRGDATTAPGSAPRARG